METMNDLKKFKEMLGTAAKEQLIEIIASKRQITPTFTK